MNFSNGVQSNSRSVSPIDSQYDFIDMVGKGTYGTAWIAKDRLNEKFVIVKAIKKVNTSKLVFEKEYKYSLSLSLHPSIITTYRNAYETNRYFVMVQEFAPYGDLFDAIVPEQGMLEEDAKHTIKQISEALGFMHSKRLVHRDVKPENIVVMNKSHKDVKLIDFGMTLRAGTHVARVCGSIPYTPPEICQASLTEGFYVDTGNDVWSLGVLLFCMLTGTFPWEQASPNDIHYKDFIDWQLSISPDVAVLWRKFSPEALSFFQRMLNLDIRKRCKVTELQMYLHFSWLESKDLIQDTSSEISSICRTPNPERIVDPDYLPPNDAHKQHNDVYIDNCSALDGSYQPLDVKSYDKMVCDPELCQIRAEDQGYFHSSSNSHSYVSNLSYPREDTMRDTVNFELSNVGPTSSEMSSGHYHHLSDGIIFQTNSTTLDTGSSSNGYHQRGSSVSHNISIC